MKIYHYHPLNLNFIGESDYEPPEGVGLPAHSTEVPPPICSEGECAIFEQNKWAVSEDHVGKSVYDKQTKAETKIQEIGPIPETHTDSPPPEFSKWGEAEQTWVYDRRLEVISLILDLESQQTPRRIREAVMGQDNGWLSDVDAQIAALRSEYNSLDN